jgi:hypothetical protein
MVANLLDTLLFLSSQRVLATNTTTVLISRRMFTVAAKLSVGHQSASVEVLNVMGLQDVMPNLTGKGALQD